MMHAVCAMNVAMRKLICRCGPDVFHNARKQQALASQRVVTDIADGKVVIDGNHPLAGERLLFSCIVKDVRPATADELAHGHVHGAHGVHH